MPTLTHLFIYPIKSLGGISVTEAVVEEKGFRYDRRFMLVTPTGEFITQRTNSRMALTDVAIDTTADGTGVLRVWHRNEPGNVLELPLTPEPLTLIPIPVTIWDDEHVPAVVVSEAADRWFSATLKQPCRLVYMPETTRRAVEENYVLNRAQVPQERLPAVSFADGYPYLLIGQASLDALNRRLSSPVGMERFRPSLVVADSQPNEEDSWYRFQVGEVPFYGVKPCARCVLTTIDPETGERGKEPLKTLATYRQYAHKILFGQNVLANASAGVVTLRVGDSVTVLEHREPWLAPPVG